MSNIGLIIEEKAADIGNFLVGRLLPFRQKRSVGPFVFIDHMGPKTFEPGDDMAVKPHPHIGLSTLTFLMEGSIQHRDSMGNSLEIKPGAVNWMTAGKGVVHSERTPAYLTNQQKSVHGLQIWVGLPKELEQKEPEFQHVAAEDIPKWEEDGVNYTLIAGEAFGKKSPVNVYSKLYFIEISSQDKKTLDIGDQLFGEVALYILEGSVIIEGQKLEGNQLIVAKDASLCAFELQENSKIYLFGGEPFPEERYIHWNFVSSSKDLIQQAKLNWYHQNLEAFPKVIDDEEEYVPLPPSSLKVK